MLNIGDRAPELQGQPVFGLPVNLERMTQKRPVVLCFVRGLNDPFARQSLALLQQTYPRFDVDGIQVVALTRSNLPLAQDFVPRYHVLYPMLCDENGEIFERFGVNSMGIGGALRAVAGFRQLGASLQHGIGLPEPALLSQQSAEFVVGPGMRVAYARIHTSPTEMPDITTLLEVAQSCLPS